MRIVVRIAENSEGKVSETLPKRAVKFVRIVFETCLRISLNSGWNGRMYFKVIGMFLKCGKNVASFVY